jgi:integrase
MVTKKQIIIAPGVRIREYPSGRKAIEIQFQFKGVACKHVLKNLDPNKSANQRYACNLKAEISNKIALGIFTYTDYFPNAKRANIFGYSVSNITMKKLFKSYLSDVQRSYPHSTLRAYKKSCDAHLIPVFGHIKAIDLTTLHIKDWVRSRNCTLKSIRNDLTPLRSVLEQAVCDEVIERNPLDKIIISKLIDREKSASRYKVEPFTENEINLILEVAEDYHPEYRNVIQFAFYSGLRTSELFGLRWTDIDWDAGTLHVQRAIVEKKLKDTKTLGSNRIVILIPLARNSLEYQLKLKTPEQLYVFNRPYERGHFFDYQHLHRPWNTILKRAGVKYRTQYQTRHTYASQLLSSGENPLFVANQMGHKTTEMIMRRYGRWVQQGQENEGHTFISNYGQNSD